MNRRHFILSGRSGQATTHPDSSTPRAPKHLFSVWRVELVFVTALVSVILTELSAAETQPHGPYTFRKARLELFQIGIGSTGLRHRSRKFCNKNDEYKTMTKPVLPFIRSYVGS